MRLPETAQTESVSRSSLRSAAKPTSRPTSAGTRAAAWRKAADRSSRAMTAAYSRSICSSSATGSAVLMRPRSHGDLQVSTPTWRVPSVCDAYPGCLYIEPSTVKSAGRVSELPFWKQMSALPGDDGGTVVSTGLILPLPSAFIGPAMGDP